MNFTVSTYLNILIVLNLTIICYLLILLKLLERCNATSLLQVYYPLIIAFVTLSLYGLSRYYIKKHNWVITAAGASAMFYFIDLHYLNLIF